MTREDAYRILTTYLTNPNLIKHSLATEETMRALYNYLKSRNPNELSFTKATQDTWGITGLLHDADYELSKGQPNMHGVLLFQNPPAVGPNVIPQDIAYAIKAHNYQNTNFMPQSSMDWAIAACDQLTGLIVAAALISPDKKLSAIDADFVLKRFYEKSFARGADRSTIMLCEEKLGIPLPEFVDLTLKAMQSISNQLEL